MKSLAVISLSFFLVACGASTEQSASADEHAFQNALRPPPGSNEMLRAPITIAEGLDVIISDVVIPANATVPSHYHPGEEFVYVIEGSAVHVEAGKPDRVIAAGEAMVIPPEAVHAPRGGPDGARAIVFRVHLKDQPERIPVASE